jgi:hypothetical protein
MFPRTVYMIILAVVWLHSGCAPVSKPGVEPASQGSIDLSGDWEYEEAALVQRISLDTQGNGIYAWQSGRIITTSVADGKWTGQWVQEGNDREGGFELNLSPSAMEADGTWWYTRIGAKTFAPHEREGPFHLKRIQAVTAVPTR